MNRLRQLLLLVVCLGTVVLSFAQSQPAATCDYTLELYDTGNNGWDGAYLEVSIDGGPITVYNVPSGSFSSYTLAVNNGSSIDANYVGAAFEVEHSFAFFDALGNNIYNDGPIPTYGPIPVIKVACPETCEYNEDFVILITAGNNPDQMSWELSDGSGTRIAYANAGTYTGVAPGTELPAPVILDICENYTFKVFDAANNSWMGGTFDILSLNADRGASMGAGNYEDYFSVLSGPGFFTAQKDFEFTLPCLECPADQVVQAPNAAANNCELNGYVFPAADIPAPVICYPNSGHGTPTPNISISYPTALPAVYNATVGTAVTLPIGSNPAVFEMIYADGQVIRCTTNILVISNFNPTMACNDNVIVPLPDVLQSNCEVLITPDMVMEATGVCDNEFIVTVYDANGQSLGSYVGADHVGQTLTYITEHIASNNICEGTITVEDKLAPHIYCNNYEIACNHPNALQEDYAVLNDIYLPEDGTLPANIAGGAFFPAPPSFTTLNFPVDCASIGEIVYNLKVKLKISHTDVGDLRIRLVDPSGVSTILMHPGICNPGAGQDIDVLFNSASGSHPSIANACSAPAVPSINGTYKPVQTISYNGLPFSSMVGNWQVIIIDTNNTLFPDQEVGLGEVVSAELIFDHGFPKPYDIVDCSDYDVQLVTEMVNETNCSVPWIGAEVLRIWRAYDIHGNSTTCEQIVQLRAPSFSDMVLPPDLDLECGSDPSVANTGLPFFDCNDVTEDQDNICDISYTYVDTEIPTCGQGRKIIREWTFVNWCASTTINHTQIIKVEDTTGPQITANDITTGTSTYDCGAEIALSAYVTDECSAISQITATYTVGGGPYIASQQANIIDITNTGILSGLPLGATEVVILAKDACGNNTLDTIEITVIDDVPPAAICDDQLHVSLQGDGTARLYAGDLDEGSIDNCGIASLEIRRTNGCLGTSQFDTYVDFVCCDTDQLIEVELKVTDANGNSSICWANVLIEDKLAPIITCPPNKIIDCSEDFSDPSIFGDAVALDNCGATISVQNDEDIDNCRAGEIRRTFTAVDNYGNEQTCVQTITSNHISDFAVAFPADVVINTCTDDPGIVGEPIIQDDDCELLAISHEDVLYNVVPDACYKIVRTWSVINWCNYDLNNPNNTNLGLALPIPRTYRDDGDGYFSYTQVIKVIDSTLPVFDANTVQDITVDINVGCGSSINVPAAIANDDCSGQLTVQPSISILTGTHGDVFNVDYIANDGCGNSVTESISVSFIDTKAPTPICINGLSVDIMQTGMISIPAHLFESGSSYDNCSAYGDLKFSFSSNVNDTDVLFTCDDIGSNTVELWVTDQAGNQDFCSTYIIVQDNLGNCSGGGTGTASVNLGGDVYTEQGDDVEDVTVNLSGNASNPYNTSSNGSYNFLGLPSNNNYTISPEKNMNPLNGVSTYDLVLISQHIIGVNPLDTPYKMIAADVNNSGSITTFDIVQLRQLILYVISDFPANDSWRFIDASFTFQQTNNPWTSTFPEFISQSNAQTNNMNLDFIAIKIGDVNGSASPLNLLGTQDRSQESLYLALDDLAFAERQIIQLDFKAKDFDEVTGFQYTLNFDQTVLEFEDVAAGLLALGDHNFGFNFLEEGVITCSWNDQAGVTASEDEVLFTLNFQTLASGNVKEVVKVDSRYTQAEAYTYGNTEIKNVDLVFNSASEPDVAIQSFDFELFQNTPNPFQDFTKIGFNLKDDSQAAIRIFNLSGQLLHVVDGDFARGYNEVIIEKSNLDASGVLYYELTTNGFSSTKKMILIK